MRTVFLLLAACLVLLPSSYAQDKMSVSVIKPPRIRCMMYCPYGNDPSKACGCLPGPGRNLCLNKNCETGTRCVVRRGTARCISNTIAPIVGRGVCRQPKVVGRCKAAFSRYFFNKKTMTCQQFIYGGCGGNENNFESLAACQQTCPGRGLGGNRLGQNGRVGLGRGSQGRGIGRGSGGRGDGLFDAGRRGGRGRDVRRGGDRQGSRRRGGRVDGRRGDRQGSQRRGDGQGSGRRDGRGNGQRGGRVDGRRGDGRRGGGRRGDGQRGGRVDGGRGDGRRGGGRRGDGQRGGRGDGRRGGRGDGRRGNGQGNRRRDGGGPLIDRPRFRNNDD